MNDLLAVVQRSGLDEAFHTGAMAVADPSGRIVARFGDTERPFYWRSAAKPFQATAMLEAGLELPDEHLAVACSSHDGTPTHLAVVRAILADGGLTESDLRCPPSRPFSIAADRLAAAAGSTEPARILNVCSGKHAAMLRTCVLNGWDTETYLDPGHPLQRAIADEMADVGALADDTVGVDGCGAPVFRGTIESVATAFSTLLDDRHAPVWTAMHRFPALVAGTGNVETVIAVGLDAVSKAGAEGLLGVTVRGRGSLAIRCWDGSERAVAVAARAALLQLGWMSERSELAAELDRPVVGGGRPVGTVRAVCRLEDR